MSVTLPTLSPTLNPIPANPTPIPGPTPSQPNMPVLTPLQPVLNPITTNPQPSQPNMPAPLAPIVISSGPNFPAPPAQPSAMKPTQSQSYATDLSKLYQSADQFTGGIKDLLGNLMQKAESDVNFQTIQSKVDWVEGIFTQTANLLVTNPAQNAVLQASAKSLVTNISTLASGQPLPPTVPQLPPVAIAPVAPTTPAAAIATANNQINAVVNTFKSGVQTSDIVPLITYAVSLCSEVKDLSSADLLTLEQDIANTAIDAICATIPGGAVIADVLGLIVPSIVSALHSANMGAMEQAILTDVENAVKTCGCSKCVIL